MRLTLLALLAAAPAHGYELKQALENLLGTAHPPPNIGQIYVTLGRLEKAGLIRGRSVAQRNRPDKRIYRLTEAGRAAVADWFEKPVSEPRMRAEFLTKLALAQRSGMADELSLINKQRYQYLTMLRELSQRVAAEYGNGTVAAPGGKSGAGTGNGRSNGEKCGEQNGGKAGADKGSTEGSSGPDNRVARLLIEGTMLHLRADLLWLERCHEELARPAE